MLEQPRFVQSSFSIIFPPQPSIRRRANEFEDVLKEQYHQPTILPIPDEFEPEVPRIVFGSTHGYSQLLISQASFSLNVSFSPEWQLEAEQRTEYLKERIPLLFELLKVCQVDNPHFCGLSNLVRARAADVSDQQILAALSRFLLQDSDSSSFVDLEVKRTKVIDSAYYSNVTIANYRAWQNEAQQVGVGKRPRETAYERGVQVLFDTNDRYAYNERADYSTSLQTANTIVSLSNEVASATLLELTEGME